MMIEEIEELRKYVNKYREIYIYGAGFWGRIIAAFLDENGIQLNGFLVTKLDLKGKGLTVLGIPVYDSYMLKEHKKIDIGIIVATDPKNHEIISENLKNKGINNAFYVGNGLLNCVSSKLKFKKNYHTDRNVNVLLYHRVGDYKPNQRGLVIDKELFEKQLKYFKDNYVILRTDEKWEDIKRNAIVLTFDDGYYDFYKNVLPLLEKYEIPGTVFVSTGNIDTANALWGDALEQMVLGKTYNSDSIILNNDLFNMDTKESRIDTFFSLRKKLKGMTNEERRASLEKLAKQLNYKKNGADDDRIMTTEEIIKCSKSSFVTIGAHTVNHCCLASEGLSDQEKEIKESKEKLEQIINKPVDVFAYPYGEREDFTNDTITLARKIGFKRVFAAYRGMTNADDDYGKIPRNDISKFHDFDSSIRELKTLELCYADVTV